MNRFSTAASAVGACALLWIAANPACAGSAARDRISLDAGWRFSIDRTSELSDVSLVENWEWTAAPENPKRADGGYILPADAAVWNRAAPHEDTFKGRVGYSWYRATLPPTTERHLVVRFTGVDDNADVFLNGRHLIHHEGYDIPFTADLAGGWNDGGPNVLLVLVENTWGPGGITGDVELGIDGSANSVPPIAPSFDDSHWRTVNVPHDYVIEQPFTAGRDANHGSLPTPSAWYRKTIIVPDTDPDQDHWLDFDGIYRDAKVYVNGTLVAEHPSGYVPLHVDVSSLARPGKSLNIAVHVDPSKFEGWWYEGGGIYRHVWLTSVDRLHIEPNGVWVIPKAVGDEAHPASANVDALVTLKNTGVGTCRYRVVERIFGPDGKFVASCRSGGSGRIAAGATVLAKSTISLAHPHVWSLDKPNLYRLETTVESNGRPVDQVTTPFGIRTVRFDPDKGFFLNGTSIKIQGLCNHQDFAGIGIAIPDNLEYWRVRKCLAIGANAWRTAHNPPTPALLDACDRLGMLVLDENRHLGGTYAAKTYSASMATDDLSDLDAMIVRDRNHPSIFAWSLCNEEPLQGTSDGAAIFQKMKDRVRRLDPTRPVTSAMNAGWGKGISLVEDIQGCNYLNESYERFHQNFPHQPMIFTESSSAVQDRGKYANDGAHAYIGDYTDPNQDWLNWVRRTEDAWRPIAETDYLSGGFVWTGFDYKGEPSPYSWPNINSHFGVLDMCGFPKDDAYYYRAYWRTEPIVHIVPHWTWSGSEGKPIHIVVFSNAPIVELALNGVSLAKKPCPRNGYAEWTVDYQPGTLVATGYGGDGRVMATDRVTTAGEPDHIVLRTDLPGVAANGEDESVVEAAIVDRQGNFVPTARDLIRFSVSGDAGTIVGTGNGDPNDHTPDGSDTRHAFSGRLAAIVRSTGKRGVVTVSAAGDGIRPASLSIQFE